MLAASCRAEHKAQTRVRKPAVCGHVVVARRLRTLLAVIARQAAPEAATGSCDRGLRPADPATRGPRLPPSLGLRTPPNHSRRRGTPVLNTVAGAAIIVMGALFLATAFVTPLNRE